MNKIGPGIAKIQLQTRAAGISACTSTCIRCDNITVVSRRRKVSMQM